jgi:hypothetical protein
MFWYKNDNNPLNSYVVLKLVGFKILKCNVPSGTTQGLVCPIHNISWEHVNKFEINLMD